MMLREGMRRSGCSWISEVAAVEHYYVAVLVAVVVVVSFGRHSAS